MPTAPGSVLATGASTFHSLYDPESLMSLSIWAALTKYRKIGGLQTEIYFSLEAGKSKVKVLADSWSGEGLLPGSQMSIFSLHPHTGEGMEGLSVKLLLGPHPMGAESS